MLVDDNRGRTRGPFHDHTSKGIKFCLGVFNCTECEGVNVRHAEL